MPSFRRALVAVTATLVASCSFVVSTDGLSGAPVTPAQDGSVAETAAPPSDAAVADVAPATDADAAPDPLAVGAIAHYRLDENTGLVVEDSITGMKDGILVNATWTSGHAGSAVALDGVKGHVKVPHRPSFEVTSAFTVALWANIDVVAYDQRLLANGTSWDIKLNDRKPQLELGGGFALTSSPLPPGEWHHIAMTYDRGTVAWFIDGAAKPLQLTTIPAGQNAPTDNGALYIGTAHYLESFAKGALDEVRLWNRVLSASEIAAVAR